MPRLTDEQIQARKLGLGASDIAEMLGVSPYQGASPVRLWAEKRGLLDDEPREETLETRLGHAVEPALVKLYCEETGYDGRLSGEFVESIVHPDWPWARCNLDGRVNGQPIGLEVKHVGIGMHADWDLLSDDGIPHYVRVQNAWQMMVADLNEVHDIVMCAGRFRVFYIYRDPELELALSMTAKKFWHLVETNQQPPLDGCETTRALLEKLYPCPPRPIEVDADEEVSKLMADRIAAADAEKQMSVRKDILSNQIREWLGKRNATDVKSADAKARWRVQRNGVRPLNVEAIGAAKTPKVRANVRTIPELIDIDGDAF
jgi:putative phage-type endonuclease